VWVAKDQNDSTLLPCGAFRPICSVRCRLCGGRCLPYR
jgi:hypothetical protein